MTQLISNVLMQPKPTDAVERPLTLIEKLKHEHDDRELTCLDLFEDGHFDDKKTELLIQQTGVMAGLQIAIDIVKQHKSWREMPSDEKPQDMQVCNLLVKNESEESPTLYDIGLYREYKGEDVWLCMTRPEEHIDPSKILAWQPMNEPSNDFFESLEQPPSEPQYLISKGGYWYRPNAKGYTASKHEAGRFSKEFAERHAKEVLEVRIFEDRE